MSVCVCMCVLCHLCESLYCSFGQGHLGLALRKKSERKAWLWFILLNATTTTTTAHAHNIQQTRPLYHQLLCVFLFCWHQQDAIPNPVSQVLPVPRGSVALFGLGLIGGRCTVRSCTVARFLLALDRLSGGFLPISGSFWINFFSTYFDLIQDSLSPLWDRNDKLEQNKRSFEGLCLSVSWEL